MFFVRVRTVQCKKQKKIPISLSARVDSKFSNCLWSLGLSFLPNNWIFQVQVRFQAVLDDENLQIHSTYQNFLQILNVNKRYIWNSYYDLKLLFIDSHRFCWCCYFVQAGNTNLYKEASDLSPAEGHLNACLLCWNLNFFALPGTIWWWTAWHSLQNCDRHKIPFLPPISSAFLAEISSKIKI